MTALLAETTSFLGMPVLVHSAAMQELLQTLERVAVSKAAVLITGETGTGKELVARALHHYSLRRSKPWVDVNCTAIPEHLIESELFGYEKGAFSGADSLKPGLFELADGGTLFLDEIGELERKVQVKLLRVLDGVPYYRLGGIRKISVDVRTIAATNLDLERAVSAGTFRRDLYHRLTSIQIRVPPLRERLDDVLPLAEFFLHQHDERLHLSQGAAEMLLAHSWPGNVRELRNTVDKAVALAQDFEIGPAELLLESQSGNTAPFAGISPGWDLSGMERRMIFQVLAKTNGHHQKAAELLGISRRTLSRKLKSYGADESRRSCMARA